MCKLTNKYFIQNILKHLMYVWPCIIYENDEKYQLDATIMIYHHKYLYMFRTSICPSSGVQVVYCCMWCSALVVVAVVLRSRCVVLCTACEFVYKTCLILNLAVFFLFLNLFLLTHSSFVHSFIHSTNR